MKQLTPILECGFFRAGKTSQQLFLEVVQILTSVKPIRMMDFTEVDTRTNKVAEVRGFDPRRYEELQPEDLESLALSASLTPWLRSGAKGRETLTNFDHFATPIKNKPLKLETDGSEWGFPGKTARKIRTGRQVAANFLEICDLVHPTYAAITVEITLESPDELGPESGSYAFRNFFISHTLGQKAIDKIIGVVPDACVIEKSGGIYVSTNSDFNERNVNVGDGGNSSAEIGRIIGRAVRSLKG